MGNKRHLRLVASNPDPAPSLSPRLRSMGRVPESDRELVGRIREYAERLIDRIEFELGDKAGSSEGGDAQVLQAINCLSPRRALELTKELSLIVQLGSSSEISLAAKSKLAEADYAT